MPPVEPSKTFDVNFTPPRAGTFMYHTHGHDSRQLVSGMYGALIVMEPGEKFDPSVDHIVLLGGSGPTSPGVEMNRSTKPPRSGQGGRQASVPDHQHLAELHPGRVASR